MMLYDTTERLSYLNYKTGESNYTAGLKGHIDQKKPIDSRIRLYIRECLRCIALVEEAFFTEVIIEEPVLIESTTVAPARRRRRPGSFNSVASVA